MPKLKSGVKAVKRGKIWREKYKGGWVEGGKLWDWFRSHHGEHTKWFLVGKAGEVQPGRVVVLESVCWWLSRSGDVRFCYRSPTAIEVELDVNRGAFSIWIGFGRSGGEIKLIWHRDGHWTVSYRKVESEMIWSSQHDDGAGVCYALDRAYDWVCYEGVRVNEEIGIRRRGYVRHTQYRMERMGMVDTGLHERY